MNGQDFLTDTLRELRRLQGLAEQAMAQLPDEALFAAPEGGNSIAVIIKHMAGNMRSRWTDFLTTDGEKPDRHRDREFEAEEGDTRDSLLARWEAGWRLTLETISALGWRDLEKTVTIRGEPHTVLEAVNRQLTHYAYHVGQIVLMARCFAGAEWQYLSIPRGKSAEYDVSKEGTRYDVINPS